MPYLTRVQKRKAQNRAAQRAFRERKEKHLKDLETKVAELEKASDAANHENGLLRAQVNRLQTELREYRKRLSLNSSSSMSRSPPIGGFASYLNGTNSNNFQFEFPRFGGLPGAQMFNNGPLAKSGSVSAASPPKGSTSGPGVLMRQSSGDRSLSPRSQTSAAGTPGGMVSSPVKAESKSAAPESQSRASIDSTNGQSRVFQFKPGSVSSTTNSPSASSTSHFGATSSAGTSPDPAQNSPAKNGDFSMDTIKEGYVCHGNSEGEIAFCEKLNMACGNPRNPVPRAMSQSNGSGPTATKSPNLNANTNNTSTPATSNNPKTPNTDTKGIDHFATQNGGQFDPILFGDYRESQAAVVGDGDFTNGFFNDAFVMPDFGSPFHFGDTPAVQKPNPLEEIEKLQDGVDEEVVPGEDTTQMLNCHKIWYVDLQYSSLPHEQDTNLSTGTGSLQGPISRKAVSTSTVSAQSFARRQDAPRAVWLWIRRTSKRLYALVQRNWRTPSKRDTHRKSQPAECSGSICCKMSYGAKMEFNNKIA